MKVQTINLLNDNYCYIISHEQSVMVIDPGEAAPVIDYLERRKERLDWILLTHAHADHSGGCRLLMERYNPRVAGPVGLGYVTFPIEDGAVPLTGGGKIEMLRTPGHTKADISFFIEDRIPLLFTGDTLFGGGCGRVFGGAHKTMWHSLLRLRDLPAQTLVYFGHEYTIDNLKFALTLEPENQAVSERLEREKVRLTETGVSTPSTLQLEKETNPFLRSDEAGLKRSLGMEQAEPGAVFAELRMRKDNWG